MLQRNDSAVRRKVCRGANAPPGFSAYNLAMPGAKKTSKPVKKSPAKNAAKKTKKNNSVKAATKPAKTAPKKSSANQSGNARKLDPQRVKALLDQLEKAYPAAECALFHRTPWELLVATILSAQCTDARVNMVTPKLFEAFPTPRAMAAATPAAIEEYVKSTGFYRNKARSIHGAAKRVVEVYGGKLPDSMDELLTLPGAARKTANVVLGVAFKKAEGVVVDTHVLRISQRLGLTGANDPKKVEQDLMRILPRDRWIQFSHEVIHHGRQVCVARKPKCQICTLEKLCGAKDKTWSSV
jgi:endonuclease-3